MAENTKTGFVKDKDGNRILPITHTSLVFESNGESLKTILSRLSTQIESASGIDDSVISGELTWSSSKIDSKINSSLSNVKTYNELITSPVDDLFDGCIRYVIDEKKYFSYTAEKGWQVMSTGGNYSDGDSITHIWVGSEPPEDESLIWLDTNEDGIIEDGEADVVVLQELLETIRTLKNEVKALNKRVEYLEEHGIANPDNPDKPDKPDPDPPVVEIEYDHFILEDGTDLLLEDDSGLLYLEKLPPTQVEEDKFDFLIMEDGSSLLLEDGSGLLYLEKEVEVKPPITEIEYDFFTLEDGSDLLMENGDKLLFEIQPKPEPKPEEPPIFTGNAVLLEDGKAVLLENGVEVLLER